MEDPQAEFISMLMDRLHDLEREVQHLKAGAVVAETTVQQLTASVHLKEGMIDFSDGWQLDPGFTTQPDCMWRQTPLTSAMEGVAIDDLHLNAICCDGPIQIIPQEDVAEDNLILAGEKGKCLIVRDLLEAINTWCRKPFGTSTNFDTFLEFCGSGPGMKGMKMMEYDHATKRWSYEMELFY